MANTTILDLPVVVTPSGQEQIPCDTTNSSATSVTKRITSAQIASLATIGTSNIGGIYYAVNYGVRADGTTDDTAALALAIAVAAVTGGIVQLSAGTSKISSTITIPTGVVIQGAGTVVKTNLGYSPFYPSLLSWSGSPTSTIITLDTFTQGAGLRNLSITGNVGVGGWGASTLKGVVVQGGTQQVFQNVSIQDIGIGFSFEPNFTATFPGLIVRLIENINWQNVYVARCGTGIQMCTNSPSVTRSATGSFGSGVSVIPMSNTADFTTDMVLSDITKPSALGTFGTQIASIQPGVSLTLAAPTGATSSGSSDVLVAAQNSGGTTNNVFYNTNINHAVNYGIYFGESTDDNRFVGGLIEVQDPGAVAIAANVVHPSLTNSFDNNFYAFELLVDDAAAIPIKLGNTGYHTMVYQGTITGNSQTATLLDSGAKIWIDNEYSAAYMRPPGTYTWQGVVTYNLGGNWIIDVGGHNYGFQTSNTTGLNMSFGSNGNGGFGSLINFEASRGNNAVQNGDYILSQSCIGWDGAADIQAGLIRFLVNGTVASGIVPGEMQLYLTDDTGASNLVFDALGNGSVVSFPTLNATTLAVKGAANVTGAVTLGSTLNVTGNVNITGTLNAVGNASFGGTVLATGTISGRAALAITGAGNVTGAMTFGSTVTATGGLSSQTGLLLYSGVAPPASGTSGVALKLGSTVNPLGIYFGSGAPSVSPVQTGSLYIRTDGTSNVTRFYVASSSATWVTFTATA